MDGRVHTPAILGHEMRGVIGALGQLAWTLKMHH
jgi:hypothetical protein